MACDGSEYRFVGGAFDGGRCDPQLKHAFAPGRLRARRSRVDADGDDHAGFTLTKRPRKLMASPRVHD